LLARAGIFVAESTGNVTWSGGEEEAGAIIYRVHPGGSGLVLTLGYRVTPPGAAVEEHVRLETTRVPRGGLRWWGRCPLDVNGQTCNRRVGKLYLPPGGRFFGCRHCHELTYTSGQKGRKHDSRFLLLAGAALIPKLGPLRTRLLDRSPVDTSDLVECRHQPFFSSNATARSVDPVALQRLVVGPLQRAIRSKVTMHIGSTDGELILVGRDGSEERLGCLHVRRDGIFTYRHQFIEADFRELEDFLFPGRQEGRR
jgi:hypothetical protein